MPQFHIERDNFSRFFSIETSGTQLGIITVILQVVSLPKFSGRTRAAVASERERERFLQEPALQECRE